MQNTDSKNIIQMDINDQIVTDQEVIINNHQELNESSEISSTDDKIDKGDCIIPWAILDSCVWGCAGATCGLCSVM